MYYIKATTAVATLIMAVWASIDIRRAGWLDRVVEHQKLMFIYDVHKLAPVKINATIIPQPKGYKDSSRWDFNSVIQLLILIKHSENTAPVQRALRRAFRPSRRLMMSMAESLKHFPSLAKQTFNDFYYDVGSIEDYEEEGAPELLDQGVIVVTNPVEARLPSTQISIKLLKDILIARAIAARELPSTPAPTIPWIPMNKTSSSDGGADAGGDDAGGGGNDTTTADAGGATGGADSTGPAAEGDATPPAEPEGEPEAEGGGEK